MTDGRTIVGAMPRTRSGSFRLPEGVDRHSADGAGRHALAAADALSGALWRLDQLLQQALVLSAADLCRLRELSLSAERSGILGGGVARGGLFDLVDRAADRARRRRRHAAQRNVSGPQHPARDRDLSLRGADGRCRDPVEMAAQQPVRPGQLPDRKCRPCRPADQLDGQGLDHGLAHHRQRLAVFSVRGDRRARAAPNGSAGTLRSRACRRRQCAAAFLPCHAAAAQERAVRDRASSQHLDVHEIRHALADDPGRRGGNLYPHACRSTLTCARSLTTRRASARPWPW